MISDWNVVVSLRQGGFRRACRLLEAFGPVSRTDYLNVLVMRVGDTARFLDEIHVWASDDPRVLDDLARVAPVDVAFGFQSPEAFEAEALAAASHWVPALGGKAFFVRMHRRGFKGRISSHDQERRISEALLRALDGAGEGGRIRFQDPDAVLDVETVGTRGGMSLWSREEMKRYPLLRIA